MIELLENACSQLNDANAFWSDQFLHIYDARHTFCVCTVEDNKLSNQILQLKFDDEDLDVIRNPTV